MKFSNVVLNSAPAATQYPAAPAPQQAPAGFQPPMPDPQGFQLPPQAPGYQQAPASVTQLPVPPAPQASAPQFQQAAPAPVTQLPPPANAAPAPLQAVTPAQAPVASPAPAPHGFQINPGEKIDDSYLPLEVRKARRMPPMTAPRKPGVPVPLSADLFQDARKAQVPAVMPAAAPASACQQGPAAPVPAYQQGYQQQFGQPGVAPIATQPAWEATGSQIRQSLARMAAEMQACHELCKLMASSPFCPNGLKGSPANVFLAIKYGESLGLEPLQALQGITVISGKPTLYGDSLLAVCKPYGDVIESYDSKTHTATCTCKRPGYEPLTRTYSLQQAMEAGLVSFNKEGHAVGRVKDGWSATAPWGAYTQRMLQMRARGFALRDAFPDILKGVISAEEASDYQN